MNANFDDIEPYSKAHLAKLCRVHSQTIRRWVNVKYYEELKELDYDKSQKVFTPKQWAWLIRKLVLLD